MAHLADNSDNKALAADYAALGKVQYHHGLQQVEEAEKRTGRLSGKIIVDYGCGDGKLSIELAKRVGDTGLVIACDPSEERIALLQENVTNANAVREREGLHPLKLACFVGYVDDVSDFLNNNAPGKKVDLFLMISVLHWVPSPLRQPLFSSIASLLNPDGLLVTSGGSSNDLHPQTPKERVLSRPPYQAYVGEGPEKYATTHMAQFPGKDALTSLANNAGLDCDVTLSVSQATFPDLESFLRWSAASSFGNFKAYGYLPEHLRQQAADDVKEEYKSANKAGEGGGYVIDVEQAVMFAYLK